LPGIIADLSPQSKGKNTSPGHIQPGKCQGFEFRGWFLNNSPKSAVNIAERAQKIEKIAKNILTGCRYQYRLYIYVGCTVLQPAERGRIKVLKKILITRKFLL
jgi:hypothetical protein